MNQDTPIVQEQALENVFISGLDPSVTEKELQGKIILKYLYKNIQDVFVVFFKVNIQKLNNLIQNDMQNDIIRDYQLSLKRQVFQFPLHSLMFSVYIHEISFPKIEIQHQIVMNKINVCGQERTLAELKCKIEDATILHHKLNNTHLKNCYLKLIPQSNMKSIIIQNLPKVFNEKDLFIMLNLITPNQLKRIIIADNPEIIGETMGVAVAIYQSYEFALKAMKALKQQGELFKCKIDVCWKEPDFDIIKELSLQTKVLCVQNISANTDINKIVTTFSKYGTVVRIQRFATHAFIEFTTVESANNALEALNDKRFEGGLVWHIHPAKKLDVESFKFLIQYYNRKYDDVDKNRTFSKNFIPEADQQILRKFLFDGQLPTIDNKASQNASNIIENIKRMQDTQISSLQMQADNIRKVQSSMNQNNNNNNNQQQFQQKHNNQNQQMQMNQNMMENDGGNMQFQNNGFNGNMQQNQWKNN